MLVVAPAAFNIFHSLIASIIDSCAVSDSSPVKIFLSGSGIPTSVGSSAILFFLSQLFKYELSKKVSVK